MKIYELIFCFKLVTKVETETQNRRVNEKKTRPDTRLPKSRAGGQGPYLRSLDNVGRSSDVQEIKS